MNYSLVSQQTQIRTCLSNHFSYGNNKIQTSKYTWYSFVPRNILEQFSKLANLYFLVLAVLQTIPMISISDGQPTILIPLVIILFVTALKDFYEDYKRKKSDNQENRSFTNVSNKVVEWQTLQVGSIVKILNNEFVPADVLILGTSEKKGICYIETKNLDGETNLKQKQAPKELIDYYKGNDNHHYQKEICLQYDMPNTHLYRFQGTYYLDGKQYEILKEKEDALCKLNMMIKKNKLTHSATQLRICQNTETQVNNMDCLKYSINPQNILLRGCCLKNTQYVYGLVIYAGHDTKIMMNSIKPHYKKSELEVLLGKQIMVIFIIQVGICIFSSLYYSIWYKIHQDDLPYLQIDHNGIEDQQFTYNFFVRFGNWLLMFGNLVPISLLVTLETVKFSQAFMIQLDPKTQFKDIKCEVQSSNLNEELGQISHIFSDKTGTLTQNNMVFKNICINGISYGDLISNLYPLSENVNFSDPTLLDNLQNPLEQHQILKVLLLLGLCHSAVLEHQNGIVKYNTSSPDELALLNFAKHLGITYFGIDEKNIITLHFKEKILQYEFYYNLEFDSSRKRNSVIVRDMQENKIYLLCKGADSVMFQRASPNNDKNLLEKYQFYLNQYSQRGLRVLVLGGKQLSEKEFDQWSKYYDKALISMQDRQTLIDIEQDKMEQDLEIFGVTAIEDKLQENVDTTIAAFREAGIKVWVLTGDKIETAINIGYSCKLLQSTMSFQIIESTDSDIIVSQLQPCQALIISGDSLHTIFQDPKLTHLFIQIAQDCKSVLCCRVSPSQKELVVRTVRQYLPEASTLAIGDGANDVSMITGAHVGVGIKGVEGQQASRCSDYSIGEFQILRQLLFVHGRECYRRNADLILYNFYKNIILVFPQFWFSIYNKFSGQRIYDNIIFQLYNIFYTSLPIMSYAIFDREYEDCILFNNLHKLYSIGLKKERFTKRLFWLWFSEAIYQSAISTFFTIFIIDESMFRYGTFSLWWTGTVIFGLSIILANLKIILLTNSWTIANAIFFIGMFAMYCFTLLIFFKSPTLDGLYFIYDKLMPNAIVHMNNILVIGVTTMVDYAMTKFIENTTQKSKIYSITQKTTEYQV